MNRQQAEHILDAYVRLRIQGGDEEATGALREVVLDAMTSITVMSYPQITWPKTTWVDNRPNIVTCGTKVVSE